MLDPEPILAGLESAICAPTSAQVAATLDALSKESGRVFVAVRNGRDGMTCDEIVRKLRDVTTAQAQARLSDLESKGIVRPNGAVREIRGGRVGMVYVVARGYEQAELPSESALSLFADARFDPATPRAELRLQISRKIIAGVQGGVPFEDIADELIDAVLLSDELAAILAWNTMIRATTA